MNKKYKMKNIIVKIMNRIVNIFVKIVKNIFALIVKVKKNIIIIKLLLPQFILEHIKNLLKECL